MTDDVVQRVLAIVVGVAGETRVPADAGPDTPLGEGGYWLDSVDLLDVLLACEEEFATRLDEDAGVPAALGSVRGLAELIRRKFA